MLKEYSIHLLFVGLFIAVTATIVIGEYRTKRFAKLTPSYTQVLQQSLDKREIVIIGDSRATDWPAKLFSDRTVLNSGIPGDVSHNLLYRLEPNALVHDPEWVIILIGINDIVTASLHSSHSARQQQLEKTFENVSQLVKAISRAGSHAILISVTPPWQPDIARKLLWGDDIDKDVAWFNQQLSTLVRTDTFYIDTTAVFARHGSNWRTLVRKDALHYLTSGYQILTEEVLSIMDNADNIQSKAL